MELKSAKPGVGDSLLAPPPEPEGNERLLDEQALWQEFAEAKTAEAFCQSWLALQCRMIAGVSGGVVVLGAPDSGPFAPVALWPEGRRNVKHLATAAERALAERRGLVLKPDAQDSLGLSQERYHVAYPIQVDGRIHGVVALDLAPRPDPKMAAVMRQLQWGSAWLEVLFRRDLAGKDAATRERLQTVLDLTATILEQKRFHAAAMAFVTALATRLGCDRTSLGFVGGGRVRVRAISHSAQFGKQTNLIRAIESAMDEAVDQDAAIVYPELPGRFAQVMRAHVDLARQHGSGAICSVPLSGDEQLLGALTLERPVDNPFDPRTVELIEALAAVAGPLLEVKRREDRWLITKAAEAATRELGYLVGPRYIGRKLIVVALVAVTWFLAVAESDYRVTAKTVIEAAVQRAAVVPFDGYIARAEVRAGDRVRSGQLLAALDTRDLRLERLKWLSQHEQFAKQYRQALAAGEAAQLRILTAQMDQARAHIALLDQQLLRTMVVAPFDGMVVSGDLSQALGSPVKQGEVLFEVAPLDAYRIILQVDERDAADVAVGQRGHLVLSAFPTERLPLIVRKLTPVSTAREGRNYFRMEAQLRYTSRRLRPGLEGVGKIEIDRRRLIWIWTHNTIDWLRLKLWSWLP